jgi:DNA topoisomerase-6 subunit B
MEEEIQLPKNEKTYKKVEISEFFEGNKHILGFDNPAKAIMTCLKEFCDNSLDACEDENILPNIDIVISKKENGKYLVKFTDNGLPGKIMSAIAIPQVLGS